MMRTNRSLLLAVIALLSFVTTTWAESWSQWRGANRDGLAKDCPPLVASLPEAGLKPVWAVRDLDNAKSGGWSSPIVANGLVYLSTHRRIRVGKDKLSAAKFPYLPPEKRTGMSDEEYRKYEQNRRDEQERRARQYRFDDIIYCLDGATGKRRWESKRSSVYTRFSQSSSPAIVGGKLYVLSAGRVARCVDANTGEDLWERQLPGEFRDEHLQSSFVVVDGVAAVVCGKLFALDAKSGEILWSAGEQKGGAAHTSPVVWQGSRNLVIANIDGKHTAAFDAVSGKEVWRVKSDAGHSTPVIVGDKLLTYGSSRKKGLRCFALGDKSAEHVWTFQGAADPGSSPVVVDGYIFVQGDRRLACVDLNTGRAKWSASLDLNRPRYTSLVAGDGKVFYAFDGVLCFAADPAKFQPLMSAKIDKTGLLAEEEHFRKQLGIAELETSAEGQKEAERLWRRHLGRSGPLPCSSPALVNGRLYLRLYDGLACYDLTK